MEIKTDNIAYIYDGSFEGLLCCVFESFERKEMPLEVRTDGITLFPSREIVTVYEKADRVSVGIARRVSPEALEYVKLAYLTDFEDKGINVLKFVRAAMRYGGKVFERMTDDYVAPLLKEVKLISREARNILQFIRFSEYNGTLISIIEPQHNVLPMIGGHFADRMPLEKFIIYDRAHGKALIYSDNNLDINDVGDLQLPDVSDEEQRYRRLWRMFYETIEIKERHSDLRRMNNMPKKYWKNMTEFMSD